MKKPTFHPLWRKALLLVVSVLFWIALWQIAAATYRIPLILPAPGKVLHTLGELLKTTNFWLCLGGSVLRITLGCLIGVLLGFLLGIACAVSRTVETLVSPVFSVVRATPVACFIILAWVFVGSANLPSFISALMVAPIMLTGTITGLRAADPALSEAAKAYRLSLPKRVRVCYLPALFPHLTTALVNCMGLAWKAGIAAEIIVRGREESIGYAIWNAKSWNVNSAELFAWTLAVIIISLLMEALLKLCLRRLPGKEFR